MFVVLKTVEERLLINVCKLFGFADTFALSKFTILFFAPERTEEPREEPPETNLSALVN